MHRRPSMILILVWCTSTLQELGTLVGRWRSAERKQTLLVVTICCCLTKESLVSWVGLQGSGDSPEAKERTGLEAEWVLELWHRVIKGPRWVQWMAGSPLSQEHKSLEHPVGPRSSKEETSLWTPCKLYPGALQVGLLAYLGLSVWSKGQDGKECVCADQLADPAGISLLRRWVPSRGLDDCQVLGITALRHSDAH